MRLKRTYSSREVAALTGLSAKQLQVWDASGLISSAIPSHKTERGGYTERRYTPIDLFELAALADLRHRGFTVPQLRTVVHVLQQQFDTRLFEVTGGGARVQLLTDGEAIYARTDAGDLYNLLESPVQPLMVVGNEGLLKELSSSLKPRRRARKTSGSEKSSRARRRDGE